MILPLAKIGLVVAGILCIAEAWNKFIFALGLTSFKAKMAPVVLVTFVENKGTLQWGSLAALGGLDRHADAPVHALPKMFLIRGLTFGALKA